MRKLRAIAGFDPVSVETVVQQFSPPKMQSFNRRGLVVYLLGRLMFKVPREVSGSGSGLMPGTPHQGSRWFVLWPLSVSDSGELSLREGFRLLPETGVDVAAEFREFKRKYGLRKRIGYF
jgi:hypothetical protein